MKRRSIEELFSKKCTYQVETPLQIKSTSIRQQLIVDHDRELTGKVNLMTWSGPIFSNDVNKKGHTTSSCILSEVTILRNKRSENVFLRNESTCFKLSRNLFFNLVVYPFYSDDKDTCVSYSCGSIDLFMS